MSDKSLPADFSDLEQFVETWALPTLKERVRQRAGSTMEELHAYYDVMSLRIDAVMSYLTGFPPKEAELPGDARRLAYLAKAFMQIGVALECFDAPEEPNVFDLERFDLII